MYSGREDGKELQVLANGKEFHVNDSEDLYHVPKKELTKAQYEMSSANIVIGTDIGQNGNTGIVFVQSRINGVIYRDLTQEQSRRHATHIAGVQLIFQQSSIAIYSVEIVKDYFSSEHIPHLHKLTNIPVQFEYYRKLLRTSCLNLSTRKTLNHYLNIMKSIYRVFEFDL